MPSVFADSWYVGKGLKQGDYFSYTVCWTDWHNCSPLQMTFWVKNQTSDGSKWNLEFLAIDGSIVQKGIVTIGTRDPFPTYSDPNISIYSSIFKTTIIQLHNFATYGSPKDLSATTWGNLGNVGDYIVARGQEQITVPSGTFNTWVIEWQKHSDSKFWIDTNLPFPLKGQSYSGTVADQVPDFLFELLQTGNSQTSPMNQILSNQVISPSTNSGYLIDVHTDKKTYSKGDNITVYGSIRSPVIGTLVKIEILNNTNTMEKPMELPADNGTFSITVPTTEWNGCGTYTIGMHYGSLPMTAQTTIYFCNQTSQSNNTYPSPLKQFNTGISSNEVKCNQGLVLVIKTSDNSPVCVRPTTAQKLVERGWGEFTSGNKTDPKSICVVSGGQWDEKYSECWRVSNQTCMILNGTYNECGSGCMHNPKALCPAVCIPFCSIK